MRRPLLLLAVVAVLGSDIRTAHAGCRNGSCATWETIIGVSFATVIVGSYAGSTIAFAYTDLTTDTTDQSLDYGGGELAVNTLEAALMGGVVYMGIKDRSAPTVAIGGVLGAVHLTLAVHGAKVLVDNREDFDLGPTRWPSSDAIPYALAMGYTVNTLAWAGSTPGRHGRTYGIWKAAVNGPLALGLGYLAYDSARDDFGPKAMLFGGMAFVSGALAYHGLLKAIAPDESPALDLLGTDLMPVTVSDGVHTAPGVAVSGSW